MSKVGRGGSLGVLDAEDESTADSSSDDHAVDTDDNVESAETTEEFLFEKVTMLLWGVE